MSIIAASEKYTLLKSQLEALALPTHLEISLQDPHHIIKLDSQSFYLDFDEPKWKKMCQSPHPLLKAIGRPAKVLDACAGLGKDGWLLANAGHQVTSTEENLLLYAVLSQAASKTQLDWQIIHDRAQNHFHQGFDIIYLDPMFVTARKAKPKQNMQIIQQIAKAEAFTDWDQAYQAAKKRLVIKHDHKSPPIITLPKPSYQISNAKKSRFDVYIKV